LRYLGIENSVFKVEINQSAADSSGNNFIIVNRKKFKYSPAGYFIGGLFAQSISRELFGIAVECRNAPVSASNGAFGGRRKICRISGHEKMFRLCLPSLYRDGTGPRGNEPAGGIFMSRSSLPGAPIFRGRPPRGIEPSSCGMRKLL